MSATSINFNGVFTRVPGMITKIDASGLEAVGLGASGIVAVVGTSVGGKPYSAVDTDDVPGTLQRSTRPGKAKEYFKSGDLLEAEPLVFSPSNDPDIEAGAQTVYWIKANQSTVSTRNVTKSAVNQMLLTSRPYGYDTTRINYQQGAGTNKGKMMTLTQDTTAEVFDDVGGDAIFTLLFAATVPADGYTTLIGTVSSTALTATFTKANAGLDGDITNQVTATQAVEVASSGAGDTTQTITVYGLDNAGDPQTEELSLNGVATVTGTATWTLIFGAVLSAVAVGTVTMKNVPGGTTILAIAPAGLDAGMLICSDVFVSSGTVTLVSSGASVKRVGIWGLDATGVAQTEMVTLTGATPVATTNSWSKITFMGWGELEAAQTFTVSGTAAVTAHATYDTVTKAADFWNNQLTGFTFTVSTGVTAFEMTDLDRDLTPSLLSSAASFYADLYAMVQELYTKSALVTAATVTGWTGAPDNTTVPLYLIGGNEGSAVVGQEATPTATAADWQAAIDLLKKLDCNTIVPITHDTSIHAYLKAHIAYMCGAGKMERDGVVGLMNAGGTAPPTKAEIKTQNIAINTRHIRTVAQECERYNTSLVQAKMDPTFTALLVAGMQAGSPVGTPLTWKYINTLGMYGDASWDPFDDADEMIELGLMFAQRIDGVGNRWCRSITTVLNSSNIAYTESSVNEAVNYGARNYRDAVEAKIVGKKAFAGTIAAANGIAIQVLDELLDPDVGAITAWQALAWELSLDVLENSVEMSPVLPTNFIKTTIHLYNTPVTVTNV